MDRDFYGMSIPEYMHDGLRRYVEEHIPTGSFLESVISNDLSGAVFNADDENIHNIPAFVNWLYSKAPGNCWGSPEAYSGWLAQRKSA